MVCTWTKNGLLGVALAMALGVAFLPSTARAQDDPKDWPMYNRDVLGTRSVVRDPKGAIEDRD